MKPAQGLAGTCALLAGLLLPAPAIAETPTSSAAAGPDDVLARIGEVAFKACEISSSARTRIVQCGRVSVPEDYLEPAGKLISLRVVRLPARGGAASAEPLLAIAGGPGQAASEAFLYLDRILGEVARDRDFYLVDQRGTGGSNPQHCDPGDEALLQVEPDSGQIREAARDCLAQFDGNPELYTTSVAVRDLEQVREALGVPQWHLFGVSYGTRVVQHYLRRHSRAIRTAVMDSVVPAAQPLGPDIALHSQQALDVFLDRCTADNHCNAAFPDLADGLHGLLARLDASPETVHYEDMSTGTTASMLFTRAHLVGVVRLALYQSEQLATLPPMLYQAYAMDNFTALARTADALASAMAESLAVGMHNSVVCTEDAPFFELDAARRAALAGTYMGDLVARALKVTCEVWPRGRLDEGFRSPVTADVPVLLLSGEVDPITPPAYAEAVLAYLPRARHLIAPGQGHFVSPRGCLPGIIARFVSSARLDNLETSCLDRLQPSPLFITVNGPIPLDGMP